MPTEPTSGPTQARWSARSKWAFAIVAGGAAVVGILVGREIAYEQSYYSFFGGAIPTFFLVVTVVGLGVTGLLAVAFRHGHVSAAIATIFAAAGLLAAGAVGGDVTASLSGGTYVPSVVLHASGTATAAMPATVGPFVPRVGGTATCDSVPDGRSVGAVTALDLGEVGSGTLRGTLSLPAGTTNGATAALWIDAGDLPDGSYQPFWSGPVVLSAVGADETAGTAMFVGLLREADPSTKSGSNAGLPAPDSWPATLSGTMTWTCQQW